MNPTIHRDTCGTVPGYRAHQSRKEERCQPCLTAWNERCEKYRPEPSPKIAEVIHEIEFLLSVNQGTGRILQAINYTGRERQLLSRLQKHGRLDLYHRIISGEYMAAA